jgi:hypothetical protein
MGHIREGHEKDAGLHQAHLPHALQDAEVVHIHEHGTTTILAVHRPLVTGQQRRLPMQSDETNTGKLLT